MKTDAQKRASKKYDETHTVQIKLKLNKKTDHDIIQKLDNKKVSTADELREQLKYYSAGETIDVLVMRSIDGEYVERTVTVTLGERPQN